MYKAAQALDEFFNGFGIDAWEEDTVPEDQAVPYITYSVSVPEWNQKATMYARIWDRSKSNERIVRVADQITAAVGQGLKLPLNPGYLVIWPETPLTQIVVDGDYRYAYINLSINCYQMPGE